MPSKPSDQCFDHIASFQTINKSHPTTVRGKCPSVDRLLAMSVRPTSSFGHMDASNILAANKFIGSTVNFPTANGSNVHQTTQVYRAIHFPRNEDFVQRSVYSEQLARLLPHKKEYQRAALWGLGGSGKTQLALDYAHNRCSDSTCSVFWVHADTETSFTEDYKWIAMKLGVANNTTGKNMLKAVRACIESLPNWVMVLDNADDLALFGVSSQPNQRRDGGTNFSMYVPRGTSGTVLWTSRDQRITSSLVGPHRGIEVVCMKGVEAEILFQKYTKNMTQDIGGEKESIVRLLSELGWLPLAITQAAAYCRRTNTSATNYLRNISHQRRKKRWRWFLRAEPDPQRRPEVSNSVLETWNISVKYIKRQCPVAYDLLMVLAYADNQRISYEFIAEIVQASDKQTSGRQTNRNIEDDISDGDETDEDMIVEAISRLEDFSFLTQRTDENGWALNHSGLSYDMHKLVQEAVSYNLHLEDDLAEATSAKTAFRCVERLFPHEWSRETWDACEKNLGHAQRTVDWARNHHGEEEVARFLVRVSNYLHSRGRWTERENVDTGILELRKAALGHRHPSTIASQARLSVTYFGQGRYSEAERIQLEVLASLRDISGDKHVDTIWSMGILATTYYTQGKYEQAEKIDKEVLQYRRDTLGGEHPETISSMASLAVTYHMQMRYDSAEQIKLKVLDLRRKALGDTHCDTIATMASLAATYFKQSRFKEAERLEIEVLDLRRQTLGDNHPDTIHCMGNLAATYAEQCRLSEAESIELEVLHLRRRVLGHRHPYTIHAMANLASTYYRQGRVREAENIGVEVLQFRRDILGCGHPDTMKSESILKTLQKALSATPDTENDGLRVASDPLEELTKLPKAKRQKFGSDTKCEYGVV